MTDRDGCLVIVVVDAAAHEMAPIEDHARLGHEYFGRFPGYRGGALHVSVAGDRLVQALRWRSEADYQACVDDPLWDTLPSTASFRAAVASGTARIDVRTFATSVRSSPEPAFAEGSDAEPGIDRATALDRGELFRMRKAFWPDSTLGEVDAVLGRDPDAGAVFVQRRRGGGLCGFAELGMRSYAEGCVGSPVPYLEGVWTDPDCRRTGVATVLVQAAIRWVHAQGFAEIASDCGPENGASRGLHMSLGFEEVGRSIHFRRPV